MRHVRVTNTTRGRELGDRVILADWFWPRLRGLILRPRIESGEGLLIVPSHGVHMFLMTYPIDVALIDRDGLVVGLYRELPPGGRTRWHAGARQVLEVPVGKLAETQTVVGDRVVWQPLSTVEARRPEDVLEPQWRHS
jgi:uncharacterized membrane protein (UPF0127 family)